MSNNPKKSALAAVSSVANKSNKLGSKMNDKNSKPMANNTQKFSSNTVQTSPNVQKSASNMNDNKTVQNNVSNEKKISIASAASQAFNSVKNTVTSVPKISETPVAKQPQTNIKPNNEQSMKKSEPTVEKKAQTTSVAPVTKNEKADDAVRVTLNPIKISSDLSKFCGHDLKDLNNNMVSLLRENINKVHDQSLDFADKLKQKRELKEKCLSNIQTKTCDSINAITSACFDAAQSSIIEKDPAKFVETQAKTMTKIQELYSEMFQTISKNSMELFRSNIPTNSWLNSNKK